MAPSMFGIPTELPSKRNYMVIEDCAIDGSRVDGKRIGLRGDIGICLFMQQK